MIHLIVGNTGAGKTTYARKLADNDGAIVFSIDEWNDTLFLQDKTDSDGLDWMLERIERAEKMIWSLCLQLDMQSEDVVLDLGFSKFSHREKFRNYCKSKEIDYKLHFLDFSKEERLQRVNERNTSKGDTYVFEVDSKMFDFMEGFFERPDHEELKGAVIIDSHNSFEDGHSVNFFAAFERHHELEMDFCMKLSTGLDNNVHLSTLRTYVLDFWEKVLSIHLSTEKLVFVDLDKSDAKVAYFFEKHEELYATIMAIESSDSVSNSYLKKLIDMIRQHIKFEEQTFYPYLQSTYDDITLRMIKSTIDKYKSVTYDFKPHFWEL